MDDFRVEECMNNLRIRRVHLLTRWNRTQILKIGQISLFYWALQSLFCPNLMYSKFREVWEMSRLKFKDFRLTFKPNECANRISSGPSVSGLHPNFSPSGKTEYAASARMRKTNLQTHTKIVWYTNAISEAIVIVYHLICHQEGALNCWISKRKSFWIFRNGIHVKCELFVKWLEITSNWCFRMIMAINVTNCNSLTLLAITYTLGDTLRTPYWPGQK